MSNVQDIDGRLSKLVDHADEFGVGLVGALELHEDGGFFVERYALVLLAQILGLGKERLLHDLTARGVAQSGTNTPGHLALELAIAHAIYLVGPFLRPSPPPPLRHSPPSPHHTRR